MGERLDVRKRWKPKAYRLRRLKGSTMHSLFTFIFYYEIIHNIFFSQIKAFVIELKLFFLQKNWKAFSFSKSRRQKYLIWFWLVCKLQKATCSWSFFIATTIDQNKSKFTNWLSTFPFHTFMLSEIAYH